MIGSAEDGEFLAICKVDTFDDHVIYKTIRQSVDEQLKTKDNNWWWDDLTQAEFETYQAFGIKEIKL